MNVKKPLFALLAASAFGAIAIPAQAVTYVETGPVIRYSIPPDEPPAGYVAPRVWREGHWSWNGYQYEWVAGHYERTVPDYYAYRAEREVIVPWRDRDADGDGVPNGLDRFPYDPSRS